MKPGSVQVTTPSERELAITRVFKAPDTFVFDAYTTPELLRLWFGPRGSSLAICEIDLKVGGAWHIVIRDPEGQEAGMQGIYREVVRPTRLVTTETVDGQAGEVLRTVVLVEDHGLTTLTTTMAYATREIRDAVLKSGVEQGASESYDRLEEFLFTIT